MNVTLRPELEKFVQEKIAQGQYASADELVSEGLGYLQWRDEARRKIDEGWESAQRGELIPGEQVDRELDEMLARLAKGNRG